MANQPPADRFKSGMPHVAEVPGVYTADAPPSTAINPAVKLIIGLLAVLLVVFAGARWGFPPKHLESSEQQPQIEVPPPAPDPGTLLPHASASAPGIAVVAEMAKPWSSKEFFIRNSFTSEDIPAVLIRLPVGAASHASGYWAFSLNSAYGNCRLEYVTDLQKLKTDYGFAAARHPMVGNPCSRTVFDPLRMTNLQGNVFARGGIVQGSDLRPPLGVEIKVQGKEILAVRAE